MDLNDKDLFQSWIDAIKVEASDSLNNWERNFVDDIEAKLRVYGRLTERQADTLERIYAEHTS